MSNRVLHLSLKKEPFDAMVTGEKTKEFRSDSKWIRSRLYDKDGKPRQYDFVKFTNGYGSDKPYFIARYNYFFICSYDFETEYSNGLKVEVKKGEFVIDLGYVTETGPPKCDTGAANIVINP